MAESEATDPATDNAIAILAPRGRDAAVAAELLSPAGIAAAVCADLDDLVRRMAGGVGAVLVTEEALTGPALPRLHRMLQTQPAWSDVPFVVLTNGTTGARSSSAVDRIDALSNAVLLSRPLQTEELTRALVSALKARTRQYEARDRLLELERQKARLRDSEAKFHAIVNSIDQMIWSTLPDGFHDYYNDRWYEYTGVPAGTTDGEAWNGVFHPDDQERAWARWRHSLATGEPYEIEYRLRHRSGDYRWVLGKALPVRDNGGAITRWYGSCTDIDDQVRARELLARSREDLKDRVRKRTEELGAATRERDRAWDMSVDLLTIVDPERKLQALNAAWAALLGWNIEELLGNSVVDLTHPDDLEATLEVFASVFERPLTAPYEFRLRHRDGSYRRFAWTASSYDGLVYASGRDVTELRHQEASLAATEQALRQSQKLETIGQLTGGVAHDFNNLLMAIRSSLDLLAKRLPADDDRAAGLVQNAIKATERGAGLTQRMLAFARKQELNPQPVDVTRLLPDMLDLIERSIGPEIAVELDIEPETADALVDANQLEMAILNLAVNARDAMNGQGRLTIALDCTEVDQSRDLDAGAYVRLRVSDTGTGMDEMTLAQAMEPFFTTKGVGKGTGLGLSMVHGLARQSGGSFRLESAPGRGTTAFLFFPIATGERQAETAHEVSEQAKEGSRTLKILAVDDDALVLFGTIAVLEDLGHQVIEAGSGADALQALDNSTDIDLIITDQAMPNMTGVELARTIHKTAPTLPVILASGYSEMPEGANADIVARLEKPFDEQTLRAAIDKALTR